MRRVRNYLHAYGGMLFERDSAKAALNRVNHHVSFEEAATVFGDVHARMYGDPDHSEDESRFLLVGTSMIGRLLIVAAIERENRVRLITARPVTRREGKSMKKSKDEPDKTRAEYSLSGGVKNIYAHRYAKGTNIVLIEPEVFMAFPGETEVNAALRLLLKAGAQAVRVKEKARKAS